MPEEAFYPREKAEMTEGAEMTQRFRRRAMKRKRGYLQNKEVTEGKCLGERDQARRKVLLSSPSRLTV